MSRGGALGALAATAWLALAPPATAMPRQAWPRPAGSWAEEDPLVPEGEEGQRRPAAFTSLEPAAEVGREAPQVMRARRPIAGAELLHVDSQHSFSVLATVQLSALPEGDAVAVSQLGTRRSCFSLGLFAGNFGLAVAQQDGPGPQVVAWAEKPATVDRWVHLVGVYDQPAGQLRVYVDGLLAGMTAAPGWMWRATGPVQVGAGLEEGEEAWPWPGDIEATEVWSGALTDAAVRSHAEEWAARVGDALPPPGT